MAHGNRASKLNSDNGVLSRDVAAGEVLDGGGDMRRSAVAGCEEMYVCATRVPPARATTTGAKGIARRRTCAARSVKHT